MSDAPVLIAPELVALAAEVGQRLRARDLCIATAESLTGGALAAALTAVPGASDYVAGGLITYQGEQKTRQLGVPPELIERCSVVSAQVAAAMAEGAAQRFNTPCAVAVTGVAGPGSDEQGHAVGTVWIATCLSGDVRPLCYAFGEVERDMVRFATVKAALRQLCEHIDEEFLRTA